MDGWMDGCWLALLPHEEDPTFPVRSGTDYAAFSINSVSLGIENSFSVYFSLDLDQFLELLGAGFSP